MAMCYRKPLNLSGRGFVCCGRSLSSSSLVERNGLFQLVLRGKGGGASIRGLLV